MPQSRAQGRSSDRSFFPKAISGRTRAVDGTGTGDRCGDRPEEIEPLPPRERRASPEDKRFVSHLLRLAFFRDRDAGAPRNSFHQPAS